MANQPRLILLVLIVLRAICPGVAVAGRYHGTVLDADTGKPLSDAAVVLQWSKHPVIQFGGGETCYAAREVLTDAVGNFSISDSPRIDWNPLTSVMRPRVAICKPGYEPLSPRFATRRGSRSFEQLRRELKHGAVIRLPKVPDERDPMRAQQHGVAFDVTDLDLIPSLPNEDVPNLIHLINIERRRFNLRPFAEPAGGAVHDAPIIARQMGSALRYFLRPRHRRCA